MASEDYKNVTIFGRTVNLEEEWKTIATGLGSLCEGNRYIEYEKEIARLRLKIIRLQEEVSGCRSRNESLSTMNDDLIERVKKLISMQDDQLEQYSSALVLLTEERKELCQALGASQRTIKQLEERLRLSQSQELVRVDVPTESEGREVVQAVESNSDNESVSSGLNEKATAGSRRLDSCESSEESQGGGRRVQRAPSRLKVKPGSFVTSMIEKLEQKHQLKSFDEPYDPPVEDDVESLTTLSSAATSQIDGLKFRLAEMETEMKELRETCHTLSNMLEKTVEEMQPSSLDTSEDTKDQLIACLRSRLFEAICDLMKVEKPTTEVRSIACGASLPRPEKVANKPEQHVLGATQSDPVLSPSRSKASRILMSPASKLRALSEDNYTKLKRLTCWRPRTAEDSA